MKSFFSLQDQFFKDKAAEDKLPDKPLLQGMTSQSPPRKEECTCADPVKCLSEMFVDRVQKLRAHKCPVKRPVFLRTHGIIRGTLTFEDLDKYPAFKHGMFDPEFRREHSGVGATPKKGTKKETTTKPATTSPKNYKVYVRYSSDLSDGRPDLKSTIGIGIKIFGIYGQKCIEDDGAGTVDLLLQNAPNFFVDNAREMCAFTKAGFDGWRSTWIDKNSRQTATILDSMAKTVPSVLATDLWSGVPFRIGLKPGATPKSDNENDYQHCKYVIRPSKSTFVGEPDFNDPDYLGKELTARMKAGPAELDLFIQVRPNAKTDADQAFVEEAYPLDRATVTWSEEYAPLIKVATIKLEKQDITKENQKVYGDWLSFNIGRVPVANKPVGSIAAARLAVYKHSADVRRDKNGQVNKETAVQGDPDVKPKKCPPSPARALTAEEIKQITHVRIHPGIGVARVGNSRQYYVGPEVMKPNPIAKSGEKDKEGNDIRQYYGYEMRDDTGAIKRQAARFRIYGYDKDGRVVAEVQESANTSVEWSVHVANKKSDWYEFNAALDIEDTKDMSVKMRNTSVKGSGRNSLIIDPGPKTIKGINISDGSYTLEGAFRSVPVVLGELKTDKVGRLLFLPGFGKAGSPTNQPPFVRSVENSFNNAVDWYDDIADGPVHAAVTINGHTFQADPAWVFSAPPNYAPHLTSWRTMNDLMRTVFIKAGMMDLPERVSFTKDVQPILERLSDLQWVNKGYLNQFGVGGLLNLKDPELLKKLSATTNGGPEPDVYRALRRTVYNNFRSTENKSEEKHAWPAIYGDAWTGDGSGSVNNYLHLPALFTHILTKWVAGDFINDYDPTSNGYESFDTINLQDQPDLLDQAAMHYCLADAFHPGCELTWPVRHASMYRAPYRIREHAPNAKEPSYGSKLTSTVALRFGGPLYDQWPGHLTRWMAIPWHGDTAFCRSGYDSAYDPYTPTYWPARVPNQVLTKADFEIVTDINSTSEERIVAFNSRPNWLRAFPPTVVPAMDYMVKHFGDMGIVTAMEVPKAIRDKEAWLPEVVYVETMTVTKEAEVAAAYQLFQEKAAASGFKNTLLAEAGWLSEEHAAEYASIRR